jgi:hypothetical protein
MAMGGGHHAPAAEDLSKHSHEMVRSGKLHFADAAKTEESDDIWWYHWNASAHGHGDPHTGVVNEPWDTDEYFYAAESPNENKMPRNMYEPYYESDKHPYRNGFGAACPPGKAIDVGGANMAARGFWAKEVKWTEAEQEAAVAALGPNASPKERVNAARMPYHPDFVECHYWNFGEWWVSFYGLTMIMWTFQHVSMMMYSNMNWCNGADYLGMF